MVAPFAFTIVETALGNIQNELISRYQEDVDLSIDEAIVTFTKDYIEDVQRRHNWVGQQIQEVIMLPFNIAAYTILLYAPCPRYRLQDGDGGSAAALQEPLYDA